MLSNVVTCPETERTAEVIVRVGLTLIESPPSDGDLLLEGPQQLSALIPAVDTALFGQQLFSNNHNNNNDETATQPPKRNVCMTLKSCRFDQEAAPNILVIKQKVKINDKV